MYKLTQLIIIIRCQPMRIYIHSENKKHLLFLAAVAAGEIYIAYKYNFPCFAMNTIRAVVNGQHHKKHSAFFSCHKHGRMA